MSASYWFEAVPEVQRFPRLEGDMRAEVAVIGGGIAGISAAYHLARAGKRVVLLEANTIGSGDSGFTTAFVTRFLDAPEATAAAYAASEAGVALFRGIIRSEKIECDWEDVDSIAFSRDEGPEALRKNFEAARAADPTLEWLDGPAASSAAGFSAAAAFRRPEEGQFHVRKFLIALAERAAARGAKLFEASEVRVVSSGTPASVRTEGGSVTADRLVVASGPPSLFPSAGEKLTGFITFVIQASYSGSRPFPRALLWDYLHPYHYFRWVSDADLILGGEDRPILPAGRQVRGRGAGDAHQNLERWLREISGNADFEVSSRWRGTVLYSPDGLPLVGPHPEYGPNVIFLTGFGGNGMAHGLLAGQIAADLVEGRGNPHAKTFALDRL